MRCFLPPRKPGSSLNNKVRGKRSGPDGFTLLELVVAVVVLSTGFVMAALTNTTTMRTMMRDLTMSDQESLIDEDLAGVRAMADRYTWCSGSGTLAGNASTCATTSPLKSSYYFPNHPPDAGDEFIPPSDTQQITNFTAACNNDSLAQGLVDLIGARTDLTPMPNLSSNDSIVIRRTVTLANPDPNPASEFGVGRQTHAIRITYRKMRTQNKIDLGSTEPVERDVQIVPTVAAWCP